MPNISVQLRRGTDAEHSSFTGAEGEVTVDTTNDTLRVHDGSTAGGIRLAKLSEAGGSGTVTSVDSGTGLTGGPITTSGTLSIADNGVTFAKMQDINTAKVIGRTTAGSGNPEEVSILDDDTMATASATSLATSESIKAYVDAQSSGVQAKCSFDGTASSPTADTGAVNVASITKTATGDYTVNFTSSVSNPVASVSVVNASTSNPVDVSMHSISSSSVRIITGTNSGGRTDFAGVHLLVF